MKKPVQATINKMVEFFNINGVKLSTENGRLIPLDQKMVERGDKWSMNVNIMTTSGVCTAYYRHEDEQFTIVGFAMHDIFLKDVPMLSNNYISNEQVKDLNRLL